MKRTKPVVNPTGLQYVTLRLMITIGVLCMILFLYEVLSTKAEYAVLYWMLIATFVFACLKILHEWIHYFFITVPDIPRRERDFTVDVFTTFCAGEPYEMIRETLIAIKAIEYPHQTFLCDEADDPTLKSLCGELGVIHVTRTVKVNAKAGNINNALQYSSADLCVVLDPDHVPFPEFLDSIISHFNDPEIGFVQIVQSYKNQDQGLIAKGAAQQTYQFYGPIMMTMNAYGTVLAIGANCTFRRAALDSIGGHAAGLAEDMHTAMQLHAKGWKSVYVPVVVARGLVPSTLSAYYSQQLKWSRGVFELFVTSYVKLFGKFTWKQQLHYGAIPIYYLSGVFILINFLIPVLALVLNTSPINFDFLNFLTIGFPLFVSVMLIRLFVQKWVMEEEERGVHIVGGLLMIGTWWVFIVGLWYTILRKKVPYIPTPKDQSEDDNWRLNIPNLLVIAISLLAIAYGLFNDWNPYNFIMAGFALINCLILSFSVLASWQYQFRRFKEGNWFLRPTMAVIANLKRNFWKLRRRVYGGIRGTALMLTVLVVCYSIYYRNSNSREYEPANMEHVKKDILIPGIFSSREADGLTRAHRIHELVQNGNSLHGIVSHYVPWGDEPQCDLPFTLLDSIYDLGAIPMVTWEPWQNLFRKTKENSAYQGDTKVFAAIVSGYYDDYLARFSKQVNQLRRPIFIRFAHEADNPQYPWSAVGGNTAEEFKLAWQYVHQYFIKNMVFNAIWVWNPWKPDAVDSYFPGNAYVDWIGVTSLNYGAHHDDGKWYGMKDLYLPFREKPVFRSGIPVMLAEMGTLPGEGQQNSWFQTAFHDIKNRFPEICAVVFFDAKFDYNIPEKDNGLDFLDWTLEEPNQLTKALRQTGGQMSWMTNRPFKEQMPSLLRDRRRDAATDTLLRTMRGVNYAKGQNWHTNGRVLKKKEIEADFSRMKEIGINVIKHYGPSVYDRNILEVARKMEMNVSYGFRLPNDVEFLNDRKALDNYADQVLNKVKLLKDSDHILMWSFDSNPLQLISYHYLKPDLFYHREAYLVWLKMLIDEIKVLDPNRPVSVDVDMDSGFDEHAQWLKYHVPDIDCFGLVAGKEFDAAIKLNVGLPYFFSKIEVVDYCAIADTVKPGVFIANWQDEQTPGMVTFNGLIDDLERSKVDLYQLANYWTGAVIPPKLPDLKILLPATTLDKNKSVTYHVLIRNGDDWQLLKDSKQLTLAWKLVRMDSYGDAIATTDLGAGVNVTFNAPADPHRYQIALLASNDSQVKVIQSVLNTSVYKFQWSDQAWSSFNLDDASPQ